MNDGREREIYLRRGFILAVLQREVHFFLLLGGFAGFFHELALLVFGCNTHLEGKTET